ncbi:LuxR C-terminal-related transcriptional regulator [Phytohabitans sp. ZYX-F-186]|uniref:LuxR C-terminal-related transcriptional regulator n=1 Tax=Phytohabitans maris TaxID=3071409 RepID=A0ABU0ZEG1_9ACTN|nr:LuxR C-terminal-related transcriptional regulator [Phytohabitans sp. ZYX-F-186]MDQ7904742.1 LuxR C-terminal-related transcriptional regulator [Phytohabitans sp. ZYX-F-186]
MGPWQFVGRADELGRIVASATSGDRRGLILSGTAGIGKTRLLREAVSILAPERYAVWTATASIAVAGLPFGGMAQVLPGDQPVGVSPAGLLRWAVDALHRQAAGRPMVLAIDDAHLLDPSSAALVYLVARDARATVLGTLRTGEQVPLPVRALWTDDLVDHDELAPLSAADTHALLVEMLGGPVDTSSADRLWRLSAGNPLLLRELVIAASTSVELTRPYGVWRWTGEFDLAPRLTDLIDARIGDLSDDVREVIELVAFGEPIGLSLLIEAAGEAPVESAEERGLIRVAASDRRHHVRLAHPLYGEVVRQRCPVTRAMRLKARLATLVEGAGTRRRDDLLRVAEWRLDSGTATDPVMLLLAGAQAFGRFNMHLGARLARAALDIGGGFDAADLLAAILMFMDRSEEALPVLESVRGEIDSDQRRSRWLVVRGLVSYWGLGRESAVDEIAKDAATVDDPGLRARVHSFEAIMRLHRLETAAACQLAQSTVDSPTATPSAHGLAQCVLAHAHAARGQLATSARLTDQVQADAPLWRAEMPYLQLALELARGTRLTIAGDLAGIDAIVADEFADLADAGDFRLGSGYLSVVRAQSARLRGRTAEALRGSLQACAVLASSRVFAGLAHAERAHAAALIGDADEAKAAMADSDQTHRPGMAILYPWREQARAWVAACGGDVEQAITGLVRLVERLRDDGFAAHEALILHDLVRLGCATLPIGWPSGASQAQTVADRLAELAGVVDGPLTALMARHAAAVSDGAELLAVADAFAELGLLLFAADAAAMAVVRLRATTGAERSEASARLGDLLARCDALRTPALRAARPALTERERQIARLAAAGVASKQIADQLFLSTRTIENHLQRVYGKLGVTNRSELAHALRALPEQ